MPILTKIFGDPNEKVVREMDPLVEKINSLEPEFEKLTNDQLRAKTGEFRERLGVVPERSERVEQSNEAEVPFDSAVPCSGNKPATLDDILPEAFAIVREAAKRTLGQRHFDVQLKGGIVLHRGQIAEMRTGEGKTLTSTLAIYLNALAGNGVHLVTVNDYLAKRDAVWMGQIYHALGMTVGIVQHQGVTFIYDPSYQGQSVEQDEGTERDTARDTTGSFRIEDSYLRPAQRPEAYQCDITYGTNNEFGFDYLRDNMVQSLDDMAQNGHAYAIVDEIDSILVDEARTPLIISAPAEEATEQYYDFARKVGQLQKNEDYEVDEKLRSATLTENGIKKMEKMLGMGNIYTEGGIRIVHHVENALRAETLFQKDRNYVVEDGQVVIIDEFTGRKMPGRRYSEGLHQAIEAKENVEIQRESRTMATVTFQNYFRMYDKLAGMTGTAVTEAEEFGKIYDLEVVVLPTNRPDQRKDFSDRIYKTETAKFKAVVEHVKDLRERGQPVLIGTISIEKNEELGALLEREGIPFEILNAKNHEREGEIVAQAGRPGAVTLATNMAGRGVDIVLGGNPGTPEDKARVKEAGGLFVLGTERHESRRIDNQLRGRSGRQGDPGFTQFYVSVDDDLMRIFAGDRIKSMMSTLKVPEDMPIEANIVTKAIETAQKKVEGHNFDIRKHLLEYDDVLNKHRETMYRRRHEILELADGKREETSDGFTSLKDIIFDMIHAEIEHISSMYAPEDDRLDVDAIVKGVQSIYSISKDKIEKLRELGESKKEGAISEAVALLSEGARELYAELEKQVDNPELMHELEKTLLIRTMDILWVDHLVAIDNLRSGIGLRGYAQRDPLVEYKRETYHLYQELSVAIQQDVARAVFKIGAAAIAAPSIMEQQGLIMKGAAKGEGNGGNPSPYQGGAKGGFAKVGRNEPCPCGATKADGKSIKYKHCHGK